MTGQHSTCPMVCVNALRAQWQANGMTLLDTDAGHMQTILGAWSALRSQASAVHPLHIIALSARMPVSDDIRAHANATQLALADMLCAALPADVPGYHRLLLDQGKVILTLVVGNQTQALANLVARVDVLYLKGSLAAGLTAHDAKRLGYLARPDARLFAKGLEKGLSAVLAAAGFILAESAPKAAPDIVQARYAPRWTTPAHDVVPGSARQAIVIGAGLAGAAMAERLTVRGWDVTVLEAGSAPAQQASGNLAGIYMPMVSQDDNPASRFNRAAYLFARQLWAQLGGVGQAIIGEDCGVLHIARDDQQQAAFKQAAQKWHYPLTFARWLDDAAASAKLGMDTRGGWFYPGAGWIRPSSLCQAMLRACEDHVGKLTLECTTAVTSISHANGMWTATGASGTVLAQAPTLILANGMAARDFEIAADLPLEAIRGQVSHVAAGDLPHLPHVLCGDGYMTRAWDGVVSIGASYGPDTGQGVTEQDHAGNLAKLHQMLPDLPLPDVATLSGRVGVRCVTPDRMPMVGAVPAMRHGGGKGIADKGLSAVPRVPGLFALLGYASRGLITAPLAAEMVACQITDAPMPVGRDLQDAVDPARFVLRALRKGAS